MLGSRKLDSLIESLDDSSLQAAAAAPHGMELCSQLNLLAKSLKLLCSVTLPTLFK